MIREIQQNDFRKGYMFLLSNFTMIGNIKENDFNNQLNMIQNNPNHKIYVLEENNIIIGTITVIIEPKLIHNLNRVAHIEDLIIDNNYKNKGYGSLLLNNCIEYAKHRKCYKVILNCDEEITSFYERNGFHKKNNQMAIYF